MAFNIMDLVKDQIGDQLLGQLGDAAGTDGSQTSIAMSGALPGLLSGLTGAAQRPGGAGALFDTVSRQDDGLLGNLGNLLGQGQGSQVADQGTSLLSSLLGDGAVGKLAGALAGFAGIGRSNTSSLLGLLAPIVIGAIKKHVMSNNLDAGGLASMLSSQQSNIDTAMPAGFGEQLKAQGFFDSIAGGGAPEPAPITPQAAPSTAQTPHTAPAEPAPSGGGLMKWLLPLAAILVLGFLGMRFFGGEDAAETTAAIEGATTDLAANATARMENVSTEALDAARAAMPDGVDLDGLTGQLDTVFDNTSTALSGITDEASASAAAGKLEEAGSALGTFENTFKRLPDAVKGPLASIVSNGLAQLQPLADKVLAMPGVGPVLEPVLRPMLDTLASLSA